MLTKDISFLLALDENPAEEYYETADALAELAKRYKALGTAVWKAEKQLLKLDEINRLTAEEVKPKSTGSSEAFAFSASASASDASGRDSLWSAAVSSQLASASAAFFTRSSRLSPSVMQPGRSGNSPQSPPFPSPPSRTSMQ